MKRNSLHGFSSTHNIIKSERERNNQQQKNYVLLSIIYNRYKMRLPTHQTYCFPAILQWWLFFLFSVVWNHSRMCLLLAVFFTRKPPDSIHFFLCFFGRAHIYSLEALFLMSREIIIIFFLLLHKNPWLEAFLIVIPTT